MYDGRSKLDRYYTIHNNVVADRLKKLMTRRVILEIVSCVLLFSIYVRMSVCTRYVCKYVIQEMRKLKSPAKLSNDNNNNMGLSVLVLRSSGCY